MAQINVILWDVDGTLLDFSAAERRALEDCFRSFQMGPCTPELLARYSQINRTYWRRLERGELTKPQVLLGRFEEFFAQEGLNCRDIPAFNQEYQLRLGDTVVFRDDAGSLVARLKGRVRQYAVTNGTRVAQERKLSRSGLDRMLDGVFISEIVGTEKPGAAFFDAVFSQIGPCCRDEVMIVGDSLTSDMQGGRSAGILCCWYNPLGEPRPADPRIDYDIRELGEQLMPLGMLVTLDSIFNRVIQNWKKGKTTWIFADEFYLLFRYEYSADFFYRLYKRIRKYSGFVTGLTQNVEELLKSDTARLMLANSEFLILLNQASTDRDELAALLNISDNQLSYITNVGAGHGLIRCSGNLVPFENSFPRNTKLYRLMTTKPGEA